jgi:hypothetical protein
MTYRFEEVLTKRASIETRCVALASSERWALEVRLDLGDGRGS